MSTHDEERERRRAEAFYAVQAERDALLRVRADAARAALGMVPTALAKLCPGIARVSADERAALALDALAFVAEAVADAGQTDALRVLLGERSRARGHLAAALAYGLDAPTVPTSDALTLDERQRMGRDEWTRSGAERWEAVRRAAPSLLDDVTTDALRREDGRRED